MPRKPPPLTDDDATAALSGLEALVSEPAPALGEYPRWVNSPEGPLMVANHREHQAVKDGTAVIHRMKSAQGDTLTVEVPSE